MAKVPGKKFADTPPCSVAVAGLVGTPPVSGTRGGKCKLDAEKEEAGGRRM
jgi:hypothetical protein